MYAKRFFKYVEKLETDILLLLLYLGFLLLLLNYYQFWDLIKDITGKYLKQ